MLIRIVVEIGLGCSAATPLLPAVQPHPSFTPGGSSAPTASAPNPRSGSKLIVTLSTTGGPGDNRRTRRQPADPATTGGPGSRARPADSSNRVHNHLTFGHHFVPPARTAADALCQRTGVCRDFARVAIAFCRAMNIPARYAGRCLGDIGVPPAGAGEFCARFEAFLRGGDGQGRW